MSLSTKDPGFKEFVIKRREETNGLWSFESSNGLSSLYWNIWNIETFTLLEPIDNDKLILKGYVVFCARSAVGTKVREYIVKN